MAVLRNDSAALARGWHPMILESEVTEAPQRVMLLGQGWVVLRMDGEIVAFPDRCPHRNARLSDGVVVSAHGSSSSDSNSASGRASTVNASRSHLECPYHGWQFDGRGTCAFIPALGPGATVPPTAHLPQTRLQVRYGIVWVAPEEPVRDVISIPEFDDPTLQVMWLPCTDIKATAGQFIDNFLDFGHFPFVHAGTFGAGEDSHIPSYDVQVAPDGWGFVVEYAHTIKNNEDPLVATGEHPLVQPREMRYEYSAPFAATLRLHLPLPDMLNILVIFLQPLDADNTRLYCAMIRNDCDTPQKVQDAIDYELAVLAEDLRIIENLWDNEIPVDLDDRAPKQTHTRADRNTIEFRRMMARLLAG